MIFSYHTIHLIAKPDYNIAQIPVVHIQTTFPYHLSRINLQRIPLLNMIIKHSGKQIIRRSNRVKISCEMKVQIFHRHNLGVTASRRAALNPETRAKRRFPKRDDRPLTKLRQRLSQTYRRRRLSFSGRSRINRRYKHKLTIRSVLDPLPHIIG